MLFVYFLMVLLHLRFWRMRVDLLSEDATFVAAVE